MEKEIQFKKVGQLKSGNYLLIDGAPCKVKEMSTAKPGRHGAAKARVVAVGVFDGQKRNLLKPTSADVEVPIIHKSSAQVVAVMGDSVQIMDLKNYSTFDVKKPSDITGLSSGVEVEYMRYGDQFSIIGKK